jgi:signal peptidase II
MKLSYVKIIALGVAGLIACIDQISKNAILQLLPAEGMAKPVTSFLNLVLVHNHGISFGMFNRAPVDAQQFIFLGVAASISLALLVWLARTRSPLISIAIGMVIGGAIGNSIDRMAHGAVIDFLDFYVTFNASFYHWPSFNVADSAIVGGVSLLFIDSLAFDKKTLQE